MSFITRLALSRQSVTILSIILVFAAGIYTYTNMQRELFPAIEFPNIFIVSVLPNSDPETVMREITVPIEDAITGMTGLNEIQSTSTDTQSVTIATFDFDVDMDEAKRDLESAINGITLPDDAFTTVNRINSDVFPVMQFTMSGDADIVTLQRIADDIIVPRLSQVDGVADVSVLGRSYEQIDVYVDAEKVEDFGISLGAISDAISNNNTNLPAGNIDTRGTTYTVRSDGRFGSLQDLRDLTVGFEQTGAASPQGQSPLGKRPIFLSDVAEIELTTSRQQTITRTNGNPALGIIVIKDPDANTVDVTEAATAVMDEILEFGVLPEYVEIGELSNDGPIVRESLDNLLREGTLGFVFAVLVVFLFLLNISPSFFRGVALALRPTAIMAVSIPLSVITGVLLMSFTDISLNFMSLAGLAIAVGRVVDDSIVVLENMYRHIEAGEERVSAALSATREVGAAIISSTLTTVAVFIPLAFIPGIVGEFFSPFAISVSLALLASTLVAITAVPVLGAVLLRQGDIASVGGSTASARFMQRLYLPVLRWSLGHKFVTIVLAILTVAGSLGLLTIIPITFFPSTTPEYLTVDIELPIGSTAARAYEEALAVEEVLDEFTQQGIISVYRTTLGASSDEFGNSGGAEGFHLTGIFIRLADPESAPEDIVDRLREAMPNRGDDVSITVQGLSEGPPSEQLEINIIGNDFNDIAAVSREIEAKLTDIDSIINIASSISTGREEVVVDVDPIRAGEYGLNALFVGSQVTQYVTGREVSEMDIGGDTLGIVLRGKREYVDDIEKLRNLPIESQFGQVKLGAIADIAIKTAPLSISRFDNDRSATITGVITAADTQAVGVEVRRAIASVQAPPGVEVKVGGIFEQINEGFQDIFVAMAVGIVLVYLVMVATLGALRTPFIIVLSLPLAIVGAFVALLVTGRTLSLSAMMGFLLLVGIVVTNAIVLLTFVEQLRARGYSVYDALIQGGRVRLRPILMTAFTTTFALIPLALSTTQSGIIGAELATVVIGGLVSSTFLTLLVIPSVYWIFNVSIPALFARIGSLIRHTSSRTAEASPSSE
ncbi:MAG: efflux RND transporter permease subunit [Chloroflexi bacterium]|nr:efflux RND transporter permease subunit [Chloroflexota bacterium]